jgi:hypothetical protein
MCTPANKASVPDSLRALLGSAVSVIMALLLLSVALTTAPFRWSRQRPTKHGRPTYPSHVEVQVHLGDRRRVADIELACHAALKRAARTWAPRPLPLDRIEVLYSAPPLGKVDLFERWAAVAPDAKPDAGSLVVISVGTANEYRDLTPDEIAGSVAGQVERLVADRYQREHSQEQLSTPTVRQPEPAPPVARPHGVNEAMLPDNVTDLSSVRSLLAQMQRSQPMTAADSSTNGIHPEPTPA